MDVFAELGELALASRLKRVSEELLKDADALYRDLGVEFQPRWFPTFYTLSHHAPLSTADLAQALGLTHPAIAQVVTQLKQAGFVKDYRDRRDDRRRMIKLTPKGRRLHRRLQPVWAQIRAAAQEVHAEAGVDLLPALERLETVLARRSVMDRVRTRLKLPPRELLRIADYRPAYKKYFRALNEEWLTSHFAIEEHDAHILSDPNGTILHKGGQVLFAVIGSHVVGTAALVRHPGGHWELCKMAVAPAMRGRGIGRRLAEEILARARTAGAECIYLQTSPVLEAAGRLYRSLGFRRIARHPLPCPEYGRVSMTMRLKLT